MGPKPSSKRFNVVADGESYKAMASTLSDIESFSPETTPGKGLGVVSEKIRQFEDSNTRHEVGIPKIDFVKRTLKGRMKSKPSKVCRSTLVCSAFFISVSH
jgi:hypothetical protein